MQPTKKKSSRPPPRLRTKTGCSKCRERRKKCDERRPACLACDRLGVECTYRDSSAQERGLTPESTPERLDTSPGTEVLEDFNSPAATQSAESPLCPSIWTKPSGLKTQRDYSVFQYCATRYIQHLVTPEAKSHFRDVSFVFSIGFDTPWVMHAALAPAALHASWADLMPKDTAMTYTQSALQGLSQVVRSTGNQSTWRYQFLVASLFLGVFEDFYSTPASHSLIHYKAMAEVLESSMSDATHLDLSTLSLFERTLLDSMLYHYSTRLMFESDIAIICNSFPSATIANYIKAYDDQCKDPRSEHPVLPVLGKTPPSLFLLIFQTTWLSRQLPFCDELTLDLAARCESEFDRIEEALMLHLRKDSIMINAGSASRVRSNGDFAAELYLIALRIFIAKVRNPHHLVGDSPKVTGLLSRGLVLLDSFNASENYSQFICWPIVVLGCAACPVTLTEAWGDEDITPSASLRSELRQLLQAKLSQMWRLSFSGYVKRSTDILKRVWDLPEVLQRELHAADNLQSREVCSIDRQYDGLKALILKEGLASLNNT